VIPPCKEANVLTVKPDPICALAPRKERERITVIRTFFMS
jgi:hypothetical protein